MDGNEEAIRVTVVIRVQIPAIVPTKAFSACLISHTFDPDINVSVAFMGFPIIDETFFPIKLFSRIANRKLFARII